MGLAGKPGPSAIIEDIPAPAPVPMMNEEKKEMVKSTLFGDDENDNKKSDHADKNEPDATSTIEVEGTVDVPDAFKKGGLARTVINNSDDGTKNKRMLHRSKTTMDTPNPQPTTDDGIDDTLGSFRSLQKHKQSPSMKNEDDGGSM